MYSEMIIKKDTDLQELLFSRLLENLGYQSFVRYNYKLNTAVDPLNYKVRTLVGNI